ncbi:MAG TPA: phosphatase PAP2 family protein [Kofleriaceae bacterium]|nr:phosphatase PAP2 family protein [Kofleriaceae bacterium]
MEIPWHHRRPAPHGLLFLAIFSAMFTEIAIYTIDEPAARLLAIYEPWPWWDQVLSAIEWAILLPVHKLAFAGFLVAGMLTTMIVGRWRIHTPEWMLVAGTYVACLVTTNPLKDLFGRLRPPQWLGREGSSFWWVDGVAFPSGHVSLFGSVVIPLIVLLPAGRAYFAKIALALVLAFVAAARIGVNAHFISDTTSALTLVALWTWLVGLAVRPLP